MNFWTPQTAKMGDGWGYKYDDYKIRGLNKHTSLALGLMIMAAFSLMATSGILKYKEEERASGFSHKAEIAKPHYYSSLPCRL